MVACLGAAALAAIGGLVSQRSRWKQVPYAGAIAAVALFVKWKFSHSPRDIEAEQETDVASTDEMEIVDEKLELALRPGRPDEESEPRTPGSTKWMLGPGELRDCSDFFLEDIRNIGVPNGAVPIYQTDLHPLDVQFGGAGLELNEPAVSPHFKDVIEDPLVCVPGSLKRKRAPMKTWVLTVEAEERPGTVAASREASNPNPAEKLKFHDAQGNLRAMLVLQDVTNLPEFSETLSLSAVVDEDVEAFTESHADANNVTSDHFPMLSVKTCKPNRVFQADAFILPICGGQKFCEETTTFPPNAHAGTNFQGEINTPMQGYRTDEDGNCHTPRCTASVFRKDPNGSPCSSGRSEAWKPFVVDICSPRGMDQGQVMGPCSLGCDDDHLVESSSPVNSRRVDTRGVGDELGNSARREYAERLRSYDDYLADPELSPTMRSQVLRARASVALYFDESDDDQ